MQTAQKPNPPTRNMTLDAAKGIAILFVVIFHVLRGFDSAALLPYGPWLARADSFAYGFHIQTFFLIAGFLAYPKAATLRFQARRQASLYYCYLLWSLLSWLVVYAMSGRINHPVSVQELLTLPFIPIHHFWFLLALMTGTALLAVFRSSPMLLLGIFVTTVISGPLFNHFGRLDLLEHANLMLIGALLRHLQIRIAINYLAGAAGLALLAASAYWTSRGGQSLSSDHLLPVSLAGCYGIYCIAHGLLRHGAIGRTLVLLGQQSLPIYVAHVMAGAGARVLLMIIVPQLPIALSVMICIAAGVVAPLIMAQLADQLGLARLLGLKPLNLPWTEPALQPVNRTAS
jgi:fucose 4-O-acetylase-like acetyltransferase